jgi:hypothetical protein
VGVVPSLDLFLVEAEHILTQIEIAGKKPELFERAGGAVEALTVALLLEAIFDVFGDLLTSGQLLFDRVQDGKAGLAAGKLEDVIDGAEEFLGLGGGKVVLLGGRGGGWRRGWGWYGSGSGSGWLRGRRVRRRNGSGHLRGRSEREQQGEEDELEELSLNLERLKREIHPTFFAGALFGGPVHIEKIASRGRRRQSIVSRRI